MLLRGLLIGLCCALSLAAQDVAAEIAGAMQAALRKTGAPSVSVAVVRDGKVIYAGAAGNASLKPKRAATASTRYAIGSVSKQFTAAALLLLQEEGKLSLDDKVSKYYPELTRANEVSIRQLLAHTAGYPDYAPQDYIIPAWQASTTPDRIVDEWARKPLAFNPGERWQYSNTNYVLAAMIFQKASGRALTAFLKEKVFDPLGMKSAGSCSTLTAEDALPYTRYAVGPPRPTRREGDGWYLGAAELCMTPSDLALWDIAFMEKRILSERSWEEFTREVKLNDGGSTRYALGLQVRQTGGVTEFEHSGEVSGFLSENIVTPAKKSAVVALSNQDCVSVVGGLARQLATAGTTPPAAPDVNSKQVRAILEGLMAGKIDRALFTVNANSYFNKTALQDCKKSLAGLGRLVAVTGGSESQRGGMSHRGYRAQFEKQTLSLNIYVTTDGKYEQFLVTEGL
jgi:D-alanyl-D-alanine carboxypeptidase